MKREDSFELDRGDLTRWLDRLAHRLRNDGLSLVGRASLESKPGEPEYEGMAELWSSLERTATFIEAVNGRLCQRCKMLDVSENVTFGMGPEVERSSPKNGIHHRSARRRA